MYIGGAIDQAVGAVESFQQISDAILKAGNITLFNPLTAYVNAQNAESSAQLNYVRSVNEWAVKTAPAAAFVWRAQPSFGVPLEIDQFGKSGKPMFIVNLSGKKLGLYARTNIMDNPNAFVMESLDQLPIAINAYSSYNEPNKLQPDESLRYKHVMNQIK